LTAQKQDRCGIEVAISQEGVEELVEKIRLLDWFQCFLQSDKDGKSHGEREVRAKGW